MNSLGFENIFKKYNISCEAPKKSKRAKLLKSKDKYAPNNYSCIHLGRSDNSKVDNEALKRNNISLPSYPKVSKSAKELKTEKMLESIRAKKRHRPLDLTTKRINLTGTNLTQNQNSSSLISSESGKYDISLESSSNNAINMEEEQTFYDATKENSNLKTQSPTLSSKSYCRDEANNSYFLHLNSKKKKRNSTPKYKYQHRPLPMLHSTAINQTSKELSIIQNPYPNGINSLELSISSNTSPSSSFNSFQRNTPIDETNELNLLIEKHSQNKTERTETNAKEIFNSSTASSSSLENHESFYSSLIDSPETSQIIDTPTTSSQQSIDQPTELDLLLELIENENKKIERTKSNAHEKSSPKRPCQKGGIEEHFLRVLNQNKIAGRYLKHDKKYGLKNGIPLRVIDLETSYGVNIATVQCLNNSNEFCTVIAPEMVAQVKIGSLIESFFDDTCEPYVLETNGKQLDFVLQPFKLLVL